MVEDHNEAVASLEEHLVKYLKGGHAGKSRPTLHKGGFLGIGGLKKVRLGARLCDRKLISTRTRSIILLKRSNSYAIGSTRRGRPSIPCFVRSGELERVGSLWRGSREKTMAR